MTRRDPSRHHILAGFVVAAALAGVALSSVAAQRTDDRKVAERILAAHAAHAVHSAHAAHSASPATSHALAEARRALGRAQQAHAANDGVHARQLEGLAREWAELAQDVDRANEAEARADSRQRAAASAALGVRKTKALIDTLVARSARARGELQQVQGASSAPIPSAAIPAARLRPPPVSLSSRVPSPVSSGGKKR